MAQIEPLNRFNVASSQRYWHSLNRNYWHYKTETGGTI